jgi:hypothetical protein
MTLIAAEDWSETDAVIDYVTAHLPPGELLEWEAIEKALSSQRSIGDALRWRVVMLEKALREAEAKIPPPRPRLMLV